MSRNPKVSVCITTYNHAPFIAQAIESALMQETDFEYEILIGEDDSTDGTREIVRRYADLYADRIRAFYNNRSNVVYVNGRPTGRWNFLNLLRQARGEFIAILDGDDYWTERNKIRMQVEFMERELHCALVGTIAEWVNQDGSSTGQYYPPKVPDRITEQLDIVKSSFLPHCSVMIRRSVTGKYPAWIMNVLNLDFCLHVIHSSRGKIGFIPKVMAVRRKHPGGIWTPLSDSDQLLENINTRRFARRAMNWRARRANSIIIGDSYMRLYTLTKETSKREAGRYLIRAFLNSPFERKWYTRWFLSTCGEHVCPRLWQRYRVVKAGLLRERH